MDRKTADILRANGIDPDKLPDGTLINGQPSGEKTSGSPVIVKTSPTRVQIIVLKPPIGKPRMTRRDKWAKRAAVVKYRQWKDLVRDAVGSRIPPKDTVLDASWKATFSPPKSWKKKDRVAVIGKLHRCKPDRDNIDKAILDCLWPESDSEIAAGYIRKVWGFKDSLEITITIGTED